MVKEREREVKMRSWASKDRGGYFVCLSANKGLFFRVNLCFFLGALLTSVAWLTVVVMFRNRLSKDPGRLKQLLVCEINGPPTWRVMYFDYRTSSHSCYN